MIFEFSNDLVPILLSISVYVTILAAHTANLLANEHVVKQRFMANDTLQKVQWQACFHSEVPLDIVERNQFITRIVKRKEAPEDDADYFFSSKIATTETIRGGQRWKTNLYSSSLKGTVFSF
ncbi:hypothetical protein [Evansella cellulosilytica]|uniref:Uncharacterized protein n=1 Tax=Evansella cellulosilytica (strain ATCC 21833 / DSM 2522 / FERM P-1141 / JCM 9156 / N-4) TaxID=649639 RepID=E6TY90_EVAC2|nr:hypothetical protein [Evansella cellulosilytica]ADU32409.1 hypothetical protein Bcell_4182 [Evansella cellulosilytica DSM 2522]